MWRVTYKHNRLLMVFGFACVKAEHVFETWIIYIYIRSSIIHIMICLSLLYDILKTYSCWPCCNHLCNTRSFIISQQLLLEAVRQRSEVGVSQSLRGQHVGKGRNGILLSHLGATNMFTVNIGMGLFMCVSLPYWFPRMISTRHVFRYMHQLFGN